MIVDVFRRKLVILPHDRITDRIHVLEVQLRYRLTTNQIMATGIGDGERITAFFVAAAEEAFEVHAPELIGCDHGSEGRGRRCDPPLALPGMDQPGAAQNAIDRAGGRPIGVTSRLFQARPQLPCAPGRMLEVELQNFLYDNLRCGMRTTLGSMSEIFQSSRSRLLETFDLLVPGFAGDGVMQAELGNTFLTFEHVGDKLDSFVHNATLFPRHGNDFSPCLCSSEIR